MICLSGKKAFRFITHGSPMIRVLLPTFYKHACHIDVKTLFELVSKSSFSNDYSLFPVPTVVEIVNGNFYPRSH